MKKKVKSNIMIILILVVMIFSFTTSNYVIFATEGENTAGTVLTEEDIEDVNTDLGNDKFSGGILYKSFVKFVAFIGDIFIKTLQRVFLGEDFSEIKQNDDFSIIYSPALIFSNKIPAFDVNFINPKTDYNLQRTSFSTGDRLEGPYSTYGTTLDAVCVENFKEYGYTEDVTKYYSDITENPYHLNTVEQNAFLEVLSMLDYNFGTSTNIYKWEYDKDGNGEQETYYLITEYFPNSYNIGHFNVSIHGENTETQAVTEQSSASILQGPVSTWYKVLRAISLVGLLSVLLYIGIRIVLSSTAAEQAKYKKWLINWFAAICIVFLLQYIMVGVLAITQTITDAIGSKIIGDSNIIQEDELMTGIRQSIGDNAAEYSTFPELVIYLVLVVYTIIFTFQYLKRVIYMAFLTMIAPLIALTYPLDKIKDSKAQAFDLWLKEYVYNALLQVIHLLLYFMFVTSATSLVNTNPIYALVAIGFLIPAEKLFRKMFGFENKESTGTFEAAAGGALTMSAINKISEMSSSSGKTGKGSGSSEKEGKKDTRTSGGANALPNSTAAWAINNSTPTLSTSNNSNSGSESEQNSAPQNPTIPIPPTTEGGGEGEEPSSNRENGNMPKGDSTLDDINNPIAQSQDGVDNLFPNSTEETSENGQDGISHNGETQQRASQTGKKSGRDAYTSQPDGNANSTRVKNTSDDYSEYPSLEDEENAEDEELEVNQRKNENLEIEQLEKELNTTPKGLAKTKVIQGVAALNRKKHFVRKLGKGLAKLTLGGLGAITTGTIGLAAGIATGDFSKAATYAATGFVAGKKMGEGTVEKVVSAGSNIKKEYQVFRQGYEGTEYEQKENERLDKKFLNDTTAINKYRENFKNHEKAMEVALEFRQNGVTDDDKIISAIKIGVQDKISISKMVDVAKGDKIIDDASFRKKERRNEFQKGVASKIYLQLQKMNNMEKDKEQTEKNKKAALQSAQQYMKELARLKKYDMF